MKPPARWIGAEICFYPVGGALHMATGKVTGIKQELNRDGTPRRPVVWNLEVRTEAGRVWYIGPEDVCAIYNSNPTPP